MSKILKNEIERLKSVMRSNNIQVLRDADDEIDVEESNAKDSSRAHQNSKERQKSAQDYDFNKKRISSQERIQKSNPADRKLENSKQLRGNSPKLNTQDIGKIRGEIEKAQEVLNNAPNHIKDKAKSKIP